MARGFLGGFVMGAALSVCAAAVLSVIAGPPVPPEVVADAPVAGETPADGTDPSSPAPRLIEGDPRQPSASDVGAPEPVDGPAIADDTTRPAARPAAARETPGVADPSPTTETGRLGSGDVTPVRPRAQAPFPGAPDADSRAAIATQPPQPAGPGLTPPERLPGADAGGAGSEQEAPVAPQADSSVAGIRGTPAPRAPGQPDQPGVSAETAPRPDISPPRISLGPTSPSAPDSMAPGAIGSGPPSVGTITPRLELRDGGAEPQPGVTPDDRGASRMDDGTAEPAGGSEDPGQAGPMIGTPATSLLDRDTGTADATAMQREEAVTEEAEEAGPTALRDHAEIFENPGNLPLMSIILMDTGQELEAAPVGLAALDSFPYPLSFAVDASLPDAAERAARYRAEGLEVMVLVDLPPNLTASDTEVALPRLLDRVPGAVAVLEGPGAGLQGSVEMSGQVAAILNETGHGIVWRPGGLDTGQRLAARAGVASQTLFRDIDSDDQTPLAIRRILDKAALRAGQEGSVIMVGRVRPDTITALVIWGLQDRVRRVAVAPVSAALLEQQEGS